MEAGDQVLLISWTGACGSETNVGETKPAVLSVSPVLPPFESLRVFVVEHDMEILRRLAE